jgi:hypothetical protein
MNEGENNTQEDNRTFLGSSLPQKQAQSLGRQETRGGCENRQQAWKIMFDK